MPQKKKVWPFLDPQDPEGLVVLMRAYLGHRRATNYSEASVNAQELAVSHFILFCQERSLTRARDVTKPVLERYQRHLYLQRKSDGAPISVAFQYNQLAALRGFFRWLTRRNLIPANPASDLDLPKLTQVLPRHVLSVEEVERILSIPDIRTPVGLRDRALLETLYSTGMRRKELAGLSLDDVFFSRLTVRIRRGKGGKQRMVPLGERAAFWIERYLSLSRSQLLVEPDERYLFIGIRGDHLHRDALSSLVRKYFDQAGMKSPGSCHLFRHTAATLMLENGADVRYVQELLGHAYLSTTQVYTRVAITKLREIHAATHPGARLRPARVEEDDAVELAAEVSAEKPSPSPSPQASQQAQAAAGTDAGATRAGAPDRGDRRS